MTATVPYDTPTDTVDAYTEELIRDAPFTDVAPLGDETLTDQDSAAQQANAA
ncbi:MULTISPECIES: hypothetical protein [Microbacterium]|uniref:hypothetical protein n=1 Tax=Microbacterium TaxID=33882 RepID=UPI0018B0EEC1|nr:MULTISPECIES: hypothetical protein [Microbacterium]MBF9336696.1 hypothetical protein [Microbacterium lacticum]MCC9055275.1 hypothetical protein [Microbacterium sp. F2E]